MNTQTTPNQVTAKPTRLLDQLRDRIRLKHYSIRTEQTYIDWVRRFILFHGKRHPAEMGKLELEAFLTDLAVAGKVSASTQNQAKSALLFLYRHVLNIDLPWLENVEQAKAPKRLPVVMTAAEVRRVLDRMRGTYGLHVLIHIRCQSAKFIHAHACERSMFGATSSGSLF